MLPPVAIQMSNRMPMDFLLHTKLSIVARTICRKKHALYHELLTTHVLLMVMLLCHLLAMINTVRQAVQTSHHLQHGTQPALYGSEQVVMPPLVAVTTIVNRGSGKVYPISLILIFADFVQMDQATKLGLNSLSCS